MTDHKGDLEVDPSLDWKPVELVADSSLYVAEREDVQDQPSGRVKHGLKPVMEIGMRPNRRLLLIRIHSDRMRCDFFAANNRMRFTHASKKINATHVIQ